MPFLTVTTSFAVAPGWSSGVTLPLILKSCATWPTFVKTNVTLPGFAIDLVESLKKNSPPSTWTEVPWTLDGAAGALAEEPAWEAGAACVFAPPAGAFSE